MSTAIIFLSHEALFPADANDQQVCVAIWQTAGLPNDLLAEKHALDKTLEEKLKTFKHIVICLQSEFFLHIEKPIVKKQARFLRKSLPFLIENELSEDIESYSLTYIYHPKESVFEAIAVDKSIIERTSNICSEVGVKHTAILSERYLFRQLNALAEKEGEKTSYKQGVSKEADLGMPWLDNPGMADGKPLIIDRSSGHVISQIEIIGLQAKLNTKSLLAFFTTKKNNENFRSKTFLKPIFYALSTSLLTFTLYNFTSAYFFNDKSQKIREEYTQKYKVAFPNEKKIFNVRRQLSGKLKYGATDEKNTLFQLLKELSEVTKELNGQSKIKSLNYKMKNATITLTWESNSRNDIEAFRDALNKRVSTNTVSISENKNTFLAMFELTQR